MMDGSVPCLKTMSRKTMNARRKAAIAMILVHSTGWEILARALSLGVP
jgi:hypothetical protein